jgi:hypothetical protein
MVVKITIRLQINFIVVKYRWHNFLDASPVPKKGYARIVPKNEGKLAWFLHSK